MAIYETVEYSNIYYWVTVDFWEKLRPDQKIFLKGKVTKFFQGRTPFMYGPVNLRGLGVVFYYKPDNMEHPERVEDAQ